MRKPASSGPSGPRPAQTPRHGLARVLSKLGVCSRSLQECLRVQAEAFGFDELELAIIIGKSGKFFGPDEAAGYIAGYTVFNDITARDIQRREMRSGVFSFCKAIDTFCPLGPWIVTPDEIGDPHDLRMELRVNGESRQESHSGNMSVTIPEILSHYSALGYSAGDVVSTGTVSGVAGFSEDAASLYLKPGDVIEAEIEKIGVLRNPVISWQEGHGEPPPPRVAF